MKIVLTLVFNLIPLLVFAEDKLVFNLIDKTEKVKVISEEAINSEKNKYIILNDYGNLFVDMYTEDELRYSIAKISYKIPKGKYQVVKDIGFIKNISNDYWFELKCAIGEEYKQGFKKFRKVKWNNKELYYEERVFTSEDHEGLEGKYSLIVAEIDDGAWYYIQAIFDRKNRIDAYKTAFSLNVEIIKK